jgi:hypothetical protein
MVGVVAFVFHLYVPPPVAVRVALSPSMIIPSFGVPELSVTSIAATGNGFTVITLLIKAVHPLLFVKVTVYVPPVFTVIELVVAPVLHAYVPIVTQVSVADAPWQIFPSLGVVPEDSVIAITGVVTGFTVIILVATPVHPDVEVTVTV